MSGDQKPRVSALTPAPQALAPKPDPKDPKAKTTRRGRAWVAKTLFLMLLTFSVVGGLTALGLFWHFSSGLPKIITVADYPSRATVSKLVRF